MQVDEQEQWIYDMRYDSLESTVTSLSVVKNKANSSMFVWCKSDIRQVITNTPDDCVVELEFEDQPVFTVRISQVNEEKEKIEEIYALCSPSKVSSLFTIASDSKYSIFKRLMNRVINYNYPVLSRVFLKDSEIRSLFKMMNEHNIRIMVHRILSYSRLPDVLDKDLRWTRRPYDEVFDDLEENDAWIKRIDFKASVEKVEKRVSTWIRMFEGGIGRDCYFKVKGDIKNFYEYVIKGSIDMIAKRLGYLEKRSESAKDKRPEPIVIQFDNPIFREKGANEDFVQKLEELKNISIIELHSNPYLHISLLDYQDGSSYGIWVVSENEINIIPHIRATVASMTRLLDHIYQKVQEGETTKYRPIEVAKTD